MIATGLWLKHNIHVDIKAMNKNNLLALMVWAIDRDLLETPLLKAWKLFQKDAIGCQKIYTDPSDELLFCKNVVGMNPIEFFTDYVLSYAKCNVISGTGSYGIYDNYLINYHN